MCEGGGKSVFFVNTLFVVCKKSVLCIKVRHKRNNNYTKKDERGGKMAENSEKDYDLTVNEAVNELAKATGVTDIMKHKDPERYAMLMDTFRDVAEKAVSSQMS